MTQFSEKSLFPFILLAGSISRVSSLYLLGWRKALFPSSSYHSPDSTKASWISPSKVKMEDVFGGTHVHVCKWRGGGGDSSLVTRALHLECQRISPLSIDAKLLTYVSA